MSMMPLQTFAAMTSTTMCQFLTPKCDFETSPILPPLPDCLRRVPEFGPCFGNDHPNCASMEARRSSRFHGCCRRRRHRGNFAGTLARKTTAERLVVGTPQKRGSPSSQIWCKPLWNVVPAAGIERYTPTDNTQLIEKARPLKTQQPPYAPFRCTKSCTTKSGAAALLILLARVWVSGRVPFLLGDHQRGRYSKERAREAWRDFRVG